MAAPASTAAPLSADDSPSPCLVDVRASTALVMQIASMQANPAVRIDAAAIDAEISSHSSLYTTDKLPPSWAADYHYCDGTDLTAQYVFVLDAVNFCFWPMEGYEYSDLAGSLKAVLQADKEAFEAKALANLEKATVERWLQPPTKGHFWSGAHPIAVQRREQMAAAAAAGAAAPPVPIVPIPLLAQRTRALREVGSALSRFFSGSAAAMVRAAGGDAARLVELMTAHFPAFRDEAIYAGRQVFLYKRAQILVGDLWGAFEGKGLGSFSNIGALTCFADYRVPQLLRALGIMVYSPLLCKRIDSREEIVQSETEIELRAATIQAVEMMVAALRKRGVQMMPFQLDWLLWERGEAQLDKLAPHHRTLTIFY